MRIWIGETGRRIFKSWNLTEQDSKNTDILFNKCAEYTAPNKNTVFSRYKFQERKQQQGETFETFVTDLRNLAKDCSYDKPSEMVRDRIVAGILSQDIREKLLTEGDTLTMDKATDLAVTYETTQQCLKSMATSATPTRVDAIKQKRQEAPRPQKRQEDKRIQYRHHEVMDCQNCGGQHKRRECPAFGQECRSCHRLNHWAKMCRRKPKAVYSINNDDDPPLFIDAITNGVKHPDTAFAVITTNTGKDIRFKTDTGSQVNVLPATVYEKMREAPPLRPSSSKIFSYSGQRLPVTGDITMECQYKECSYTGVFHVNTPPASQPILGLPACLQLKVIQIVLSVDSGSTLPQNDSLLTKNTVIEEYKHHFSGLGDLEGEITIHLKENATPVVHPPHRVPHAIKQRLKEELDKMENTGVINKVTTPTDWVNSLVVVEKENGKLRICLDPKDLNAAIKDLITLCLLLKMHLPS